MLVIHPAAVRDRGGRGVANRVFARFATEPGQVGPQAPMGAEGRWIKTIPGKDWFVHLRIYGPRELACDGSWQLPDFESVGLAGLEVE